MKAHGEEINGRLVAHFIVQTFEMLPKSLFNVINSAFFICLLLLMSRFLGIEGKTFPLLCLFGALVVFVPAFGEVFFWLDGSINYLWAILLNLLFLTPFFLLSFQGKTCAAGKLAGLAALGFFAGAYQETMSAVTIFLSVIMLIYAWKFKKVKVSGLWFLPPVTALLGLVYMATRPAEIQVKTYAFDPARAFNSFLNVADSFYTFGLLICIFAFAFTLCILFRRDKDVLVLAGMFFVGFLAANCMMIVASIYPPRTASPAAIFLILAAALPIKELFSTECRKYMIALSAVLLSVAAFQFAYGAVDIASVFAQYSANVNTVNECKAAGQRSEIQLSSLYGSTKFSVAYEMGFPSGHEYINEYISKYFDVDSIVGVDYYEQFYGIRNPDRTIY